MCKVLESFDLVWSNETVPGHWSEGLMISLFKKDDKQDLGNYMGITLLSVVRKLYSRILDNCLLKFLEASDKLHEGQGGFKRGRSCIDNIFFA